MGVSKLTPCENMSNLIPGDSNTYLMTFEGRHTWTIKNWATCTNCTSNPEGKILYSDLFIIPVDNENGLNQPTRWQIMAFPKNIGQVAYLGFKLICLDRDLVPYGSFYFCTYTKSPVFGKRIHTKFAPLALDAAEHYSTCIRLHPEKNLTICVKIKIVCCEGGTRYNAAIPMHPDNGLPQYNDVVNNPINYS